MLLLTEQPTLTELHSLIKKVPAYPITVRQLVKLADRKNLSEPVVDFYRSFPSDEIFEDKEDLLSRTENVEMLHHQVAPVETVVPQED